MKTVLHISKYYAPDMGGIETVAKYLAEGMTSFKNIIVCFSTNGKNSHDVINNIDVYRTDKFFAEWPDLRLVAIDRGEEIRACLVQEISDLLHVVWSG